MCIRQGYHIQSGDAWNQLLDTSSKDVVRSVFRGLGPAKRSHPLEIDRAINIGTTWGRTCCDLERPIDTVAMLRTGIYYLTREIELSGVLQHEMTTDEKGDRHHLLTASVQVQERQLSMSAVEWSGPNLGLHV